MAYPRFVAYDFGGTLIWSMSFVLAGRFFGDIAKRSQSFFGLLSHWHSWRWVARLYDNVTLCTQKAPGDWSSALAQIKLN